MHAQRRLVLHSRAVDYSELTVSELKNELRARSLPLTGLKAELVERLLRTGAEIQSSSVSATDKQQEPSTCKRPRSGAKAKASTLDSSTEAQELKQLEEAASANRAEFDRLLKAKLDGWRIMKAEGILDKLGMDGDFEETVVEMDEMSKRLLRRRRGAGIVSSSSSSSSSSSNSGSGSAGIEDEQKSTEVARSDLLEKLAVVGNSKAGSAVAVQSWLNEVKDKELEDTELFEAALLALSKLGSNSITVAAFKQYQKFVDKGSVQYSSEFINRLVNACFASEVLCEAATTILGLVGEGAESKVEFLPGITCREIYASTTTGSKPDAARFNGALSSFYTRMPALETSQVNIVLRALGKRRLVSQIFELVDKMRQVGPAPDDETIEFLANALVSAVEEEAKAKTMKDLPKPAVDLPEVVFAGRSNVGKSSLVNFMVNRKALASTSATPGHTTQFHFFAVNAGREDLPSFRLVDVPGLGYAEADEGQQDSWRSLLERYLTVRDSLHMVFHLVDSRHKLTAVDQQMMVMATRAAATRKEEHRTPLRFAVVLTKTDRASEKALRESIADVKQGTKELAAVLDVENVPILLTSSVARQGRDELWRLLIESLSYAKQ